MTATTETGRHVTPGRIARGVEAVERAGFVLRYECPLGPLDDIVDHAMIDSGFLERLCAQTEGDQEPTDNWREVLRAP